MLRDNRNGTNLRVRRRLQLVQATTLSQNVILLIHDLDQVIKTAHGQADSCSHVANVLWSRGTTTTTTESVCHSTITVEGKDMPGNHIRTKLVVTTAVSVLSPT